jgi:hypothetical protein
MSPHVQKRLQQIEDRLMELGDQSLTPGLTRSQRNEISLEVKNLLKEQADLQDNRNHWLAETQPSMGDVIALVKRELSAQRKVTR